MAKLDTTKVDPQPWTIYSHVFDVKQKEGKSMKALPTMTRKSGEPKELPDVEKSRRLLDDMIKGYATEKAYLGSLGPDVRFKPGTEGVAAPGSTPTEGKRKPGAPPPIPTEALVGKPNAPAAVASPRLRPASGWAPVQEQQAKSLGKAAPLPAPSAGEFKTKHGQMIYTDVPHTKEKKEPKLYLDTAPQFSKEEKKVASKGVSAEPCPSAMKKVIPINIPTVSLGKATAGSVDKVIPINIPTTSLGKAKEDACPKCGEKICKCALGKALSASSIPRLPRALAVAQDQYRSATSVLTRSNSRFAKDIHTGPLTGELIGELKDDAEARTHRTPTMYKSCNICGRTYMAKSQDSGCPTCSVNKSMLCSCGHELVKGPTNHRHCPLCG